MTHWSARCVANWEGRGKSDIFFITHWVKCGKKCQLPQRAENSGFNTPKALQGSRIEVYDVYYAINLKTKFPDKAAYLRELIKVNVIDPVIENYLSSDRKNMFPDKREIQIRCIADARSFLTKKNSRRIVKGFREMIVKAIGNDND